MKQRHRRDEAFLKDLGERIQSLIKKRGFKSPYDFWIEVAGDDISRAGLNRILRGKTSPSITTLRRLSKLLKVSLADMVDVE